jgi:hypothetical protein
VDTLWDGKVKISARYDILTETNNKKYARNERQGRITFAAIEIRNNSKDTLYLPEDLCVFGPDGFYYILTKNEAFNAICQSDWDEDPDFQDDLIEDVLIFTIAAANFSKEVKANKLFMDELDKYYLTPCLVAPKTVTIGLLAMDVDKGTPIEFLLRSQFSPCY